MGEPCFECHAPAHKRPCSCDHTTEIARLQAEVEEWKGHAIKRAQERNTAFNRIETLQDERDTAQSRIAELEAEVARLRDPQAVFASMMAGTIATPTYDQLQHLYPEERDTAWNDAIEAAKDAAYQWAQVNSKGGNIYTDLLHALRALRR